MHCPLCNHENLPGADTCVSCHASLPDEHDAHRTTGLMEDLTTTTLGGLVPRTPVEVAPETPISEVIQKLLESGRNCALVMQDGRMVGIFTERDVLQKAALQYAQHASAPVSTLMTPNPESLRPDDTVAFALNKMTAGGYRHVPIVQDQKPIGVVSVRNVVSYLANRYPDELGTAD